MINFWGWRRHFLLFQNSFRAPSLSILEAKYHQILKKALSSSPTPPRLIRRPHHHAPPCWHKEKWTIQRKLGWLGRGFRVDFIRKMCWGFSLPLWRRVGIPQIHENNLERLRVPLRRGDLHLSLLSSTQHAKLWKLVNPSWCCHQSRGATGKKILWSLTCIPGRLGP